MKRTFFRGLKSSRLLLFAIYHHHIGDLGDHQTTLSRERHIRLIGPSICVSDDNCPRQVIIDLKLELIASHASRQHRMEKKENHPQS